MALADLGRSDIGLPAGHLTSLAVHRENGMPFKSPFFCLHANSRQCPPTLAYVVVVAKQITDVEACAPKPSQMGPCEPQQ